MFHSHFKCSQTIFKNFNFNYFVRNSENGARYDQSAVLDRNAELSNFVSKMNKLITKREDNGRSTMDLRAALRWAGWKSSTDLDEALEVFNFDFESGVKPDETAAYETDIGEGSLSFY